jgi:hypothetical protein
MPGSGRHSRGTPGARRRRLRAHPGIPGTPVHRFGDRPGPGPLRDPGWPFHSWFGDRPGPLIHCSRACPGAPDAAAARRRRRMHWTPMAGAPLRSNPRPRRPHRLRLGPSRSGRTNSCRGIPWIDGRRGPRRLGGRGLLAGTEITIHALLDFRYRESRPLQRKGRAGWCRPQAFAGLSRTANRTERRPPENAGSVNPKYLLF